MSRCSDFPEHFRVECKAHLTCRENPTEYVAISALCSSITRCEWASEIISSKWARGWRGNDLLSHEQHGGAVCSTMKIVSWYAVWMRSSRERDHTNIYEESDGCCQKPLLIKKRGQLRFITPAQNVCVLWEGICWRTARIYISRNICSWAQQRKKWQSLWHESFCDV